MQRVGKSGSDYPEYQQFEVASYQISQLKRLFIIMLQLRITALVQKLAVKRIRDYRDQVTKALRF